MSELMTKAVDAINAKLDGETFDGSIKVVIGDEGSLLIDENGAALSDADADCTMTADAETFMGIMSGDVNATAAFMGGKLSVDGDMSQAMKLASVLG